MLLIMLKKNRIDTPSVWLVIMVLIHFSIFEKGVAQPNIFKNPIVEQRADPWVYKTDSGTYYFIATVPEYDRIELRKSNSIQGFSVAEAKTIWRKHEKGIMGQHIWAPELHKIDGIWYIYFAAGETEKIWNIRMYVLSNASSDPMSGEWKEEGQIITKRESFSLDATTFEHKGKRYLIWAQHITEKKHGTGLLLSEMSSPTSITGPEIVISESDFDWEKVKYEVNEGPAVIKRNGRIFVTYSASATDHNYAVGLLWINENENLLDSTEWHKSPKPVFYTNEETQRFGPGHSCFTIAEDGKTDILIYHARNYKELEQDPLRDPNRNTRARELHWDADGFPDFRQEEGD